MIAPVGVAVVGCGFASDFYLATLAAHPGIRVTALYDRIAERAERAAERFGVPVAENLSALVDREDTLLVVNLTNPAGHAEVTEAALSAGRHVYSEKPLTLDLAAANRLVKLADSQRLVLACAPANVLGESIQTLWREIRSGAIGAPRLVYAELDDGAVHAMRYREWLNDTGVPWPYRDEFEMGCVLEHAGYQLQPLTSMFGPIRRVAAEATTVMPDKFPPDESGPLGPDFATATLTFETGVVARLTCSTVAPKDHSLTVIGDGGVLRLADCWDFGSPITARIVGDWEHSYLTRPTPVEPVRSYTPHEFEYADHRMDFARGVAEAVEAAVTGRPCRLGAAQALHVLEATLAISRGESIDITSEFTPPEPEDWAR
ncbi:putative dehydrogenase [Stackebrandtia endophytica]|uniref:Putative dehydrogenase n=1 Tax=Stackebrandtia endophytica TaxID=1496996 RepID=A0A543AZ92_9ACTN|nr:Gfo/Idh/MocA family oxidoreductase [Stackebrandtia endophytica]TQL77897.1 putative dehydrogenase [Stackebrandtia endophytica]